MILKRLWHWLLTLFNEPGSNDDYPNRDDHLSI